MGSTSKVIPIPVPTNVITGFLGVGKTTLIRHLLDQKPENEKWAVLVNEFGEIGIDGAFFKGRGDGHIFVREVPGGCMCCTSGLPMQIALNQLLSQAQPDRLLIEPTGLGHPKEVLETLQEDHYADVLDLRATLTLVDARVISDSRYAAHETFRQQLQVADRILATKSDLYENRDRETLSAYLTTLGLGNVPVREITHGQIPLKLLESSLGQAGEPMQHEHHHHHHHADEHDQVNVEAALKNTGAFRTNQSDGEFHTHSWAFSPDRVFQYAKVLDTLTSISIERLKAVFITEKGIFAFNKVGDTLTSFELDESPDSRLELITSDQARAESIEQTLESALFKKTHP